MFFIDDILTFPVKGLCYIFRELHEAVEQDAANQAEAIRTELGELYLLLETGQISEEEADAREKELLDLLEEIEARGQDSEEEADEVEEEDDEGPDTEMEIFQEGGCLPEPPEGAADVSPGWSAAQSGGRPQLLPENPRSG